MQLKASVHIAIILALTGCTSVKPVPTPPIAKALPAPTSSVAIESCPGVDVQTAARPDLGLPPIMNVTSVAEDRAQVPAAAADAARRIVGGFESSPNDNPYLNVSTADILSVGFGQWNVKTGSFFDAFVAGLSPYEIAAANPALGADLSAMQGAMRAGNVMAARAVVDRWMAGNSPQPAIRADLRRWLGTEEMRTYQLRLMDSSLRIAHALAGKWLADSGLPADGENLIRLTVYFFDMWIYNGDRAGIWLPHVQTFRRKVGGDASSVIEHVAQWLQNCSAYVYAGTDADRAAICKDNWSALNSRRHTRTYGLGDIANNISHWRTLAATGQISELSLNLFIFGYLRALASNGNDCPHGFPGIYSPDVLNRRGTVALGSGTVHGHYLDVDQLIRSYGQTSGAIP